MHLNLSDWIRLFEETYRFGNVLDHLYNLHIVCVKGFHPLRDELEDEDFPSDMGVQSRLHMKKLKDIWVNGSERPYRDSTMTLTDPACGR
jgi:hypothetical protein